MNYREAFITLYGAAGAAIEELYNVHIVDRELKNSINILKKAIDEAEEMIEEMPDDEE